MLQHEKIDALFQLLKEMTLYVRKNAVSTFSRWMERIEKVLMIVFATTLIALVIAAVWYRPESGKPVHGVPEPVNAIYLLGMFSAVLYLITATIDLAGLLWRSRREHFAAILRPLEKDLFGDASFVARLSVFDKPILEYGLVQYRHCCGISDGRVAMLAGDIRKIGLFPALMAAALSAAALLKEGGSNPFLWAPLILACCFYLVGFVVNGQRERASQVIALLEYAVSYADAPTDAPTAVGTEHDRAKNTSIVPDAKNDASQVAA